jgi:hypothetical protein
MVNSLVKFNFRCGDTRKLQFILSYFNQTSKSYVNIAFNNATLNDSIYYDEEKKMNKIGFFVNILVESFSKKVTLSFISFSSRSIPE